MLIKRPLCLNELAQRIPANKDTFAFVDIRKYPLKFVSLSDLVRFQFFKVRRHTLLFAQYKEDFCSCTKLFNVCQHRGFVHLAQFERYVRPQYGNGSVPLRWLSSN